MGAPGRDPGSKRRPLAAAWALLISLCNVLLRPQPRLRSRVGGMVFPGFFPLTFMSSCSDAALHAGSGAPGHFLPGQCSELAPTLACPPGELRVGHSALLS